MKNIFYIFCIIFIRCNYPHEIKLIILPDTKMEKSYTVSNAIEYVKRNEKEINFIKFSDEFKLFLDSMNLSHSYFFLVIHDSNTMDTIYSLSAISAFQRDVSSKMYTLVYDEKEKSFLPNTEHFFTMRESGVPPQEPDDQ